MHDHIKDYLAQSFERKIVRATRKILERRATVVAISFEQLIDCSQQLVFPHGDSSPTHIPPNRVGNG
ncbi:hypothetical protein DWW58_00565 [Olsenella sp. AF16-14LB]|nr:hypothetical protein DWW58_00565 [Olsenella sp. AF16-14LB]RGU83696.1 hypothetical protein DWW44_00565 [Olsenella sp. AF15-43LB]RHB56412.1 hypothetical protein DW878_04750 [Olsenella sp. AM39-30AC]RHD74767.1 hypothetical protein DW781_05055 [Olsenella sp. AM30-3LB]RHK03958.1 hypothetical protein DW087_04470 [Olsenella sp. AM04-33]